MVKVTVMICKNTRRDTLSMICLTVIGDICQAVRKTTCGTGDFSATIISQLILMTKLKMPVTLLNTCSASQIITLTVGKTGVI